MTWIGWRVGSTGAALGLTTWLATPWVAMALHGTVDARHAAWLRGVGGPRVGRAGHDTADTAMPRAWDTIPGPRPRVRGRVRAASS